MFVTPDKSELLHGSKIVFHGKNNILYIEDGTRLDNSVVVFSGNNSVIYLSSSWHLYHTEIYTYHNSVVYIGRNCYFNPSSRLKLLAAERQNLIIGEDGLLSHGIYIRTTDPHLVYSCENKTRMNRSKSIMIGDHVWIGQGSLILKGTRIGSGAIVGGQACVANRTVRSNSVVAGNPAKPIKENVFFRSDCVNGWTEEITRQNEMEASDQYIYYESKDTISMQELDEMLKNSENEKKRLEIVISHLVNNKSKNRFSIVRLLEDGR